MFSFTLEGTNKRILKPLYDHFRMFQATETVSADLTVVVSDFKPAYDNCYVIDQKYRIKDDYIYCKDSYKAASWKLGLENAAGAPTLYFNGNTLSSFFYRST